MRTSLSSLIDQGPNRISQLTPNLQRVNSMTPVWGPALTHRISDKAEAAYRRGDQFEKRRKLMEAWATSCEPVTRGNVVKLAR